jgi:acyl carrier protein
VLSRNNSAGEKELVAYTVFKQEDIKFDWRSYLLQTLPDFMIPAWLVPVPEIPLTSHGKTDRRALAKLETIAHRANSSSVRHSGNAAILASLWAEVLGVEEGIIDDDSVFFALGGHSIKAIRLRHLIQLRFKIALTIKEIFNYSRFGSMLEKLDLSSVMEMENIPKAPENDSYPLSSAQQRLWILCQYGDAGAA